MKEKWNDLSNARRIALLAICYPTRSVSLLKYEATLTWDKLLPSTQQEVGREMERRQNFYDSTAPASEKGGQGNG